MPPQIKKQPRLSKKEPNRLMERNRAESNRTNKPQEVRVKENSNWPEKYVFLDDIFEIRMIFKY